MRPRWARDKRGELWIWREPAPGESYIIAADTAEGIKDGDFCAAQVLDMATGAQVAEWETLTNPTNWAHRCCLLALWYNTAMLAFETGCSAHGVSALNTALTLGYANLYRRRVLDQAQRVYTKKLGWATTARTKPYLLDAARDAVREGQMVRSPRLLAQMKRTKIGEAPRNEIYTDGHDDLLIAFGIACIVRTELWTVGAVRRPEVQREAREYEDWVSDQAQEQFEREMDETPEVVREERPWSGRHR